MFIDLVSARSSDHFWSRDDLEYNHEQFDSIFRYYETIKGIVPGFNQLLIFKFNLRAINCPLLLVVGLINAANVNFIVTQG